METRSLWSPLWPRTPTRCRCPPRADGQLTFNTGALASGRVGVEVTVSDGTATGTGMVYFSVKPANTLAAVIDPVAKTTVPNTDTVVKLSSYVHGTSLQPAQLTQVDTPNGASTTTNAADMSLTFKATNPGTYYVPYIITQGSIPATGLARVEVQPATGEAAKPVAANDVALLGADNTAIVEPLTNDVDPMGGVLSVTTVSAPADSGIKVGLVSHKRVYITARQVAHEARRPYLHRGQRLRNRQGHHRVAAAGSGHLEFSAQGQQYQCPGAYRRHRVRGCA